ncbi:MAG: hypothetical protein IKW46_02835 [Bacteroidaceae bacterium]|nr:hypothetical protein [Bacteroidaceae bacterium]
MKKKAIIIVCVLLAIVLLFPIPMRLRDGGTIQYKAILYTVSDVHSLAAVEDQEAGKEFNEGIIIEILGFEIVNNVN